MEMGDRRYHRACPLAAEQEHPCLHPSMTGRSLGLGDVQDPSL